MTMSTLDDVSNEFIDIGVDGAPDDPPWLFVTDTSARIEIVVKEP